MSSAVPGDVLFNSGIIDPPFNNPGAVRVRWHEWEHEVVLSFWNTLNRGWVKINHHPFLGLSSHVDHFFINQGEISVQQFRYFRERHAGVTAEHERPAHQAIRFLGFVELLDLRYKENVLGYLIFDLRLGGIEWLWLYQSVADSLIDDCFKSRPHSSRRLSIEVRFEVFFPLVGVLIIEGGGHQSIPETELKVSEGVEIFSVLWLVLTDVIFKVSDKVSLPGVSGDPGCGFELSAFNIIGVNFGDLLSFALVQVEGNWDGFFPANAVFVDVEIVDESLLGLPGANFNGHNRELNLTELERRYPKT